MNFIFKLFLSIIIFTFFCFFHGIAQSENIWIFGRHAGVDFGTTPPTAITSSIEGFGEGQASICDQSGNLLFYSEGTLVWDKNGNIMPNGSDLTGIVSVTSYTATSSTSQGVLIIPKPGTTTQFYIFSLTSTEQNATANAGKLFYSLLDMNLNGGLGDIVPGQKGILIDTHLSERLAAVVGNQCNIWVMVCSIDAKFKAFEITHNGVNTNPVISTVGIEQEFTGYIAVSPNREKLAATKCFMYGSSFNGASIYDFDANTGIVSNRISLLPQYGGYGVAFSPDNSKLYVNADFQHLFQYDLNAGSPSAILASETRIGDASMTGIKSGPDGKLYFKTSDGALSAIGKPNLSGSATEYTPVAIALAPGTTIHSGLPNDVPIFDFDLDTLYNSESIIHSCLTGQIRLEASDLNGWDYQWSNGTDTSTYLDVNTEGTYWVQYRTLPCTYNVDSFTVFLPTVKVKNSCNSGENGAAWIEFPFEDSTLTFKWENDSGEVISLTDSITNISAGTYYVELQNADGCESKIIAIIENNDIQVSFISSDTLLCIGDTVIFTNTSDNELDHFEWQYGDGSNLSDFHGTHFYENQGEYTVRLIGQNENCIDTGSMTILVDEPIDVEFSKNRFEICTGERIEFYPQVGGEHERVSTLSWDFGDGSSYSNSPETFEHAFDKSGDHIITLTSHFRACPNSEFKDTVRVYPIPKVNLGTNSSICLKGEEIYLANIEPNDPTSSLLWSTGETSATIIVRNTGLYKLTVTSEKGCINSESMEVNKDCFIDIPNAFTPNNDGNNDYFFPRQLLSKNIIKFKMQVFNRWGQIIFETSEINGRGWDGKFNDKDQPIGVFLYLIETEFANGMREKYEGNVTLIR